MIKWGETEIIVKMLISSSFNYTKELTLYFIRLIEIINFICYTKDLLLFILEDFFLKVSCADCAMFERLDSDRGA